MLLSNGLLKCDRCGKTMIKENVNYSYLPFEKNPERKLLEYCERCIIEVQKEFSATLKNI